MPLYLHTHLHPCTHTWGAYAMLGYQYGEADYCVLTSNTRRYVKPFTCPDGGPFVRTPCQL